MRAVSENEEAAKLMGINNNFIISLTFIIGSALAAIGVIIYLIRSPFFRFTLGSETIGLYPFVAAVVGGIGSLPGAVIGGFLIGIIRAITQVYSNIGLSSWVETIIFGIFVIILLFKPSGILGKDIREKV
jgi:branched-chain amino acid transport system permease protein